MNALELSLNKYIDKCRELFPNFINKKIIPFPGVNDQVRRDFGRAKQELERENEFNEFASVINRFPEFKTLNINCIRQLASWFFVNTGTYYQLWNNLEINKSNLLDFLLNEDRRKSTEIYRLLVFDGFNFLDKNNRQLNEICLPDTNIKLKIYERGNLEKLFKFPHSEFHGFINQEKITELSRYHILEIKFKEKFKTPLVLRAGDVCDFLHQSPTKKKREDDIDFWGPIFLTAGNHANLAEEIIIKTNFFEIKPIFIIERNGFLPEEIYFNNRDVEFIHPSVCINIGEKGKTLIETYKAWNKANSLEKFGLFRFATQIYVKSIMNLSKIDDFVLETFVNLITTLESLLNPEGGKRGGSGRIANRGSSLLFYEDNNRELMKEIIANIYKTRSKIVHEGHPYYVYEIDMDQKKHEATKLIYEYKLRGSLIFLSELVREIFIKYIFSLCFILNNNKYKKKIFEKQYGDLLEDIIADRELAKSINEELKKLNINFYKWNNTPLKRLFSNSR